MSPRIKKLLKRLDTLFGRQAFEHKRVGPPKADCRNCKGAGKTEQESGHNGDLYMETCDCNLVKVTVSEAIAEALKPVPPKVELRRIDDDTFTLEQFDESVEYAHFTDDDGFGLYATLANPTHVTVYCDRMVHPSDFDLTKARAKKYTHVVWSNK